MSAGAPPELATRTVDLGEVSLQVVDEGSGPLVVLCHGFPELAYSWRRQIPALVDAGYRVIAPDQRGYGGSSRPNPVESYDMLALTGDILGLIDDAEAERAVVVGHDWGAMVVWSLAQRAPERLAGVAGMSVPFVPRGPMPPVQLLRQLFGDLFFYMLYFQEPGVADEDLGRDPERFLRRMFAGLGADPDRLAENAAAMFAAGDAGFVERLPEPSRLPDWLPQADLDHYVEAFTHTGFTGPVNWYRNLDRNWEIIEPFADRRIEMPALFVVGEADPVLAMTPPALMDGWVADLRASVTVPGAGHWVQQEKPDEVNEALLGFLAGIEPRW